MYSTPGISQSSFSIGLVTRSSTSCAEAPGICTKTSIIGTMICGSSSRGSFQTAKAPMSSDAADDQRRQLGGDPRVGEASGGTKVARLAHCRTSTRAPSCRPAGTGSTTFSPGAQAGEHLDRVAGAPSRGDQPGVRRAVFHDEDRLQLAALGQRGRAGWRPPFATPSGKMARPNMPERNCGAAGRSIFTM